MTTTPRVPPLSKEQFDDEQKQLVGDWHILNFSRVLVRHPSLYRVFVPFIEKLIAFTELPPRDREILCLRTLSQCDEHYELQHHEDIARNKVNMSGDEISNIKAASTALHDFDKVLIKAVDELITKQRIQDDTWSALQKRYSTVQLMELTALVGCYVTMAMLTKTLDIQAESDNSNQQELEGLRRYT